MDGEAKSKEPIIEWDSGKIQVKPAENSWRKYITSAKQLGKKVRAWKDDKAKRKWVRLESKTKRIIKCDF